LPGRQFKAARSAGYSAPGPDGFKLIRKRHIREEIEWLQASVAKTGNEIIAKAIADSVPDKPIEPDLAKSLVARRGADDEARAVVSMGYVMAAMIESAPLRLAGAIGALARSAPPRVCSRFAVGALGARWRCLHGYRTDLGLRKLDPC
jgi:hypothetical protein